jgi:hypothetical protein
MMRMDRIHKPSRSIIGKKGQDSIFSQIPPIIIGLILLIILLVIFGIIFRREIPKILEGIWNWLTYGGG